MMSRNSWSKDCPEILSFRSKKEKSTAFVYGAFLKIPRKGKLKFDFIIVP